MPKRKKLTRLNLTHPPWTNLADKPLGFQGIGFSLMFALLKPTFSLPLRLLPLTRVLPLRRNAPLLMHFYIPQLRQIA
ncbi:hypothetical protein V6Z12_A01G024600 [Gossypium hirsutum]